MLPIDYDEDDYLLAAEHYAQAIRAGDFADLTAYDYNYEHPPLTKLAYAAAILPLPPASPIPELSTSAPPAASLPEPDFHYSRIVAMLFGTAEVLAIALLSPLAGLFLAIHTWQIKYTSQIMLEPLPAFASAVMVIAYARWRQAAGAPGQGRSGLVWLALSAAALGITAGSKYVYCIAALAVVADWLWRDRPTDYGRAASYRALLPLLAWGLAGLAVFVAVDPRLWADPLNRLAQSVLYHASYAQSQHVKDAGYPAWQPLVWLAGPVPWHPGVFLFPLDLMISLLALAGLRAMWRDPDRRVWALWLVLALAFLLWWTTKWPQYVLILIAPLSMAAGEGFKTSLWGPAAAWWGRFRVRRSEPVAPAVDRPRTETRRALPWLLPGLIALAVLAVYPMVYQAAMSLTDFNTLSIKDGFKGGIWRAAWQGLTLQVPPQETDMFSRTPATSKTVNFTGLSYYGTLFFGFGADLLVFNVLFAGLTTLGQTVIGVSAALLLDRPGLRFRNFWRSVLILPWAIPEFVGALIWLRIFAPQFGWLPEGLPKDVPVPSILDDKNFAMFAVVVAATWGGFPLIMLAATAGLKLIPREALDAAAIDGAGAWARFRYVLWPLVWPLVLPALLIRAILAFNQFYLMIVMQLNYPLLTLSELSYLTVQYFGGRYAVSAAINIFTVLILTGLIIWFNRWSKADQGVTYA